MSVAHRQHDLMDVESLGTLFVVGTPIGNLDDLSSRARRVLGAVDLIACEDTRRTGRLLSSIGVDRPLIPYHDHNETEQAEVLLKRLNSGESVALVSDAGIPTISDPGLTLVRAASAQGVTVTTVPGPNAALAALSISGLATDRFVFEGFLPRRASQRDARLESLAAETRTLIFYEAVHRVEATLAALEACFGADRSAAIARELTKLHEQVATGSLATLKIRLGTEIPLKGEFVLLVAGREADEAASDAEVERIFAILARELPAKTAVAMTAEITGRSRNDVYRLTRT
ncbi:MAG: 16S rRNA (cytidine(1402)-2'-O)-methyltransferase [Gammaproteobacteria bacterium]